MIIKGISASLPSRIVTNDDMVEMIKDQSTEFEGDLDKTLETIKKLLDNSGKEGGTGLGLAYCKRTMKALDGDIYCESELGEYTAFRLSFPDVAVQTQKIA